MREISPLAAGGQPLHRAPLIPGIALLALCALLASLAVIAPGCQRQLNVSDLSVQDLDYDEVEALRTDEKLIKKRGPVVFLDIRPPADYEEGHIPGAINIPLPQIVGLDHRLANARTIIIYGDGWDDPLAPVAWKKMRALRYEGLHTFRGGVKEWVEQGRSLEEGPDPTSHTP